MDIPALRFLLAHETRRLSQIHAHKDLKQVFALLGLAEPPPPPAERTKAQRAEVSLDATADALLPFVAAQLLAHFPPPPSVRNKIQDLLWSDEAGPQISKKLRRELARALSPDDLFIDGTAFMRLLGSLWPLDDGATAFLDPSGSLQEQIERHLLRNPGDISTEDLFERLGAYDCSDGRFRRFIEGLASSEVRPDENDQRRFAQLVNEALSSCGAELRETGEDGGYPVFTIVSRASGSRGRAKNLIFASFVKPDLVFRDAIDNDIEIVTNADKVLVYERPLSPVNGLRWRELQAWWSDAQGLRNELEAKRTLYHRLRSSVSKASPPELALFDAYHAAFGAAVPDLPALLPQVWLHWDPKTIFERGANALSRFRMDFLLLLPANVRVVVEVDGKQHYADADGQASPTEYARMVAADRDLKLARYEVYRFGAAELFGDACQLVKPFFEALFKRYGVTIP